MSRPQYVNLSCPHCGHKWLEPTINLLKAQVVVYRDVETSEGKTVERRIPCPNCGKDVTVDVPKEWLEDE